MNITLSEILLPKVIFPSIVTLPVVCKSPLMFVVLAVISSVVAGLISRLVVPFVSITFSLTSICSSLIAPVPFALSSRLAFEVVV